MWAGGLVGALNPTGTSGRSPRRKQKVVLLSTSEWLNIVSFVNLSQHLSSSYAVDLGGRGLLILRRARPTSHPSYTLVYFLAPMASLVQSLPASAVRKQSTTALSGYLRRASQPIASSGLHSSVSSCCLQSRSLSTRTSSQLSQRFPSHVAFSTQQRRTFVVQLQRQSQTVKENTSSTTRPPPSASSLQLTNLPYFIRRTASNQLPVYLVTKAGGTKQQTKIQKTEGDLDALRNDLAQYLGLESSDSHAPKSPDVTINRLTGHIIVKGWRKPEIQKFLLERNF
ncbi:hypothetical protein AOCH_004988 [Aspergillus ochraceoroseus]|uniref:Large ribosomal subunit protein mL49 n=2 Tax=Aspergillus ochraceoroseus TaxID=138278 RepID=A0A0F8XAT8_9EURO|nr:hypothetical protein AOCH_004988 [Aspergillus ochraceoroseus]